MINAALVIILIIVISYFIISGIILKRAINVIKSKDKNREQLYYNILNLWLENRNNKKFIKDYLEKFKVRKIVVYGCGELGMRLAEELLNSGINDISLIDSNKTKFEYNGFVVTTKNLDEFKFRQSEVIIVTPIHQFDNIKRNLENRNIRCPIISLQKIVEDMFFEL